MVSVHSCCRTHSCWGSSSITTSFQLPSAQNQAAATIPQFQPLLLPLLVLTQFFPRLNTKVLGSAFFPGSTASSVCVFFFLCTRNAVTALTESACGSQTAVVAAAATAAAAAAAAAAATAELGVSGVRQANTARFGFFHAHTLRVLAMTGCCCEELLRGKHTAHSKHSVRAGSRQ